MNGTSIHSIFILTWRQWSPLGWQMWLHADCPPLALEKDTSGYLTPGKAELINCRHQEWVKENISSMCRRHCAMYAHPLAESGGKVVKNKVWEGLRHGANVWNIVSHHHIVKSEISSGSKRQVAYHKTICKCTRKKKSDTPNADLL